jgi:hypothetical protein
MMSKLKVGFIGLGAAEQKRGTWMNIADVIVTLILIQQFRRSKPLGSA